MVLDHYQLLGIPRNAGLRQIKTAYRNLAKRCHPDRNQGSEAAAELFRQANLAYRVLSNPAQRRRYDQELARQQTTPPTSSAAKMPSAEKDPNKFKNFLNSLLDALFGPLSPAAQSANSDQPGTRRAKRANKISRPDFNFYYHLAVEKESAPYRCGRDGVYRRSPRNRKRGTQPSQNGRS
jgi:curved DNA-binding protein CbpA